MKNKTCSTCKEEKAIEDFSSYFEKRNQKTRIESRCKSCEAKRNKKFFEERPTYTTNRHRKWAIQNRYNMSLEKYYEILEKQNNVCAICEGKDEKALAIDHDRSCCSGMNSCGKCIRGLLCQNCNNGIGRFKDNVELFKKAILYLEKSNGKKK
jgi:hypothetical protein